MSMRFKLAVLLTISAAVFGTAATAPAQCLSWEPGFSYSQPGVSYPPSYGGVRAMTLFDDGSGPALYLCGGFLVAGDIAANNIVKWDGTHFTALGDAFPGNAYALTTFDDGTGPALYVAVGSGTAQIMRWSGLAWTTLPGTFQSRVYALGVYDDGTGAALYAGGTFLAVDSTPIAHIARWNGSSWSSVGGGTGGTGNNDGVYAFQVFDDGSGPALFVGGLFSTAGAISASSVAKWNGFQWSKLGAGVFGEVYAMTVFDDGTGAQLYVGGGIITAGGMPAEDVARWNGSKWQIVGAGNNGIPYGTVYALRVYDAGSGAALYAAGNFKFSDPTHGRIARWTGTTWADVGTEVHYLVDPGDGVIYALALFNGGSGSSLYAGGIFDIAGGAPALSVASWNGSTWSALRPPGGWGASGNVYSLATFDAGSGARLYAGGAITEAGGVSTGGIAQWNGSMWSPVGGGLHFQQGQYTYPGGANALLVFDGPAGNDVLYVGGYFTNPGGSGLATWNGTSWSVFGAVGRAFGDPGTVYAFAPDTLGATPALFIGGSFNTANGIASEGVARFDPHTAQWSGLGSGTNSDVYALATFNDGSGMALYAAGAFTAANGVPAQKIARWNGVSWSAVGGGFDNNVLALAVFDDGSGSALYAGGGFATAGGVPASTIARWNGASWAPVGAGLSNGVVFALTVYDDGGGPALYAAGGFTTTGNVSVSSIAKWNGHSWSALGSGMNDIARAFCAFDDGHGESGAKLFVGGDFTAAGAIPSTHLAAWRHCTAAIDTFCFGDGTVASCPCGNTGLHGHGCDNSAATGGARLFTTGTTQPDALVLHSAGELPSALSVFLQGNAPVPGSASFGDGLRCVGGSLKRLYVNSASSGAANAPGAGDLSITAQSAALGDPIAPGSTRYYQTYYRDPNLAFCPPPQGDAWNVTNGVIVVW
jgi:hypothetical protein